MKNSHKAALAGIVAATALTAGGIALNRTAAPTAPPTVNAAPPASCHSDGIHPDPACTPGATNPDVTDTTVTATVCVPGWTATVRPQVAYTNTLKATQMTAYGFGGQDPRSFEEDHFLPLGIGGDPTDPKNLWPQPMVQARKKDVVEHALQKAVCGGRLTLARARQAMLADWTTALTATGITAGSSPAADTDDS